MPDEQTMPHRPAFTRRPGARPDPPADLLARVAGGDRAAFAELYDQMAPRVYGLARRVVRDGAMSEEVTQDVMVELWRTARRYDHTRGSITSWVLTVAHRRAIDRVRAEHSSRRRTREFTERSRLIDYDHTAEQAAEHADAHSVRQCLTTLTGLQRATVELAYYDGYTYPEVADALDVTLPAVKARMRAALQRLRACLEDLGHFPETT